MLFNQAVITVSVQDLDASVAFYTDVLGFDVIHRIDDLLVQIEAPGMIIALRPHETTLTRPESPHVHIGLITRDLDATKTTLERRGVTFIGDVVETEVANLAFFNDLDGNAFYLCQWMEAKENAA